jgi:hypothetical protein
MNQNSHTVFVAVALVVRLAALSDARFANGIETEFVKRMPIEVGEIHGKGLLANSAFQFGRWLFIVP